jgi:hypothetical protein
MRSISRSSQTQPFKIKEYNLNRHDMQPIWWQNQAIGALSLAVKDGNTFLVCSSETSNKRA